MHYGKRCRAGGRSRLPGRAVPAAGGIGEGEASIVSDRGRTGAGKPDGSGVWDDTDITHAAEDSDAGLQQQQQTVRPAGPGGRSETDGDDLQGGFGNSGDRPGPGAASDGAPGRTPARGASGEVERGNMARPDGPDGDAGLQIDIESVAGNESGLLVDVDGVAGDREPSTLRNVDPARTPRGSWT